MRNPVRVNLIINGLLAYTTNHYINQDTLPDYVVDFICKCQILNWSPLYWDFVSIRLPFYSCLVNFFHWQTEIKYILSIKNFTFFFANYLKIYMNNILNSIYNLRTRFYKGFFHELKEQLILFHIWVLFIYSKVKIKQGEFSLNVVIH